VDEEEEYSHYAIKEYKRGKVVLYMLLLYWTYEFRRVNIYVYVISCYTCL